MHFEGIRASWLVVEKIVVHAEAWVQALKGAVWRVPGAAATVAVQGHRVGDGRVHAGRAVGKLERLVVEVLVRAHVLVDIAERNLNDGVLFRGRKMRWASLNPWESFYVF